MAVNLPYCANCQTSSNIPGIIIRKCDRCQSVCYCSKMCQKIHWNEGKHKGDCDFLRDLSSYKNRCKGNFCTPEGLIRMKRWWSKPCKPPLGELLNPGKPPVTGGIYTLELKSDLYNKRLCIVLGKAPKGRLTVLCRSKTGGTEQDITERPICVLPNNLHHPGVIRVDNDWYGYTFALRYPVLYETAFFQTPRIVTALDKMGLAASTMQLVPVIPSVGAEQIQCHANVKDVCRGQRNCAPVFGYSLLSGLSCGCINIEAHSIILRKSGFLVDVTPDQDNLAAKFFVADPDISFDEFNWLSTVRLMRLIELGRQCNSISITPAVTPTGRAVLGCSDRSCKCNTELPEVGKSVILRGLALQIILYCRHRGVDFTPKEVGGPIQLPPKDLIDTILGP